MVVPCLYSPVVRAIVHTEEAALAGYKSGVQPIFASFEGAGRGCLAWLVEMLAGSALDVINDSVNSPAHTCVAIALQAVLSFAH